MKTRLAIALAAASALSASLAEARITGVTWHPAKAARKLQKDVFLIEEDVQKFINEAQASDVLR